MRTHAMPARPLGRLWPALLGFFALWLVVQNSVLFAVLTSLRPDLPVDVLVVTAKLFASVLSGAANAVAALAANAPGGLTAGLLAALKGGMS